MLYLPPMIMGHFLGKFNMLASAYSTSDSQFNSPGHNPERGLLFSTDRSLIGTPSNTNATSNPSPTHEHDFEGSEHDGEEGAG